jgi:hypothetical protein
VHAFGLRRHFGERRAPASPPRSLAPVALEMVVDGRPRRSEAPPIDAERLSRSSADSSIEPAETRRRSAMAKVGRRQPVALQ